MSHNKTMQEMFEEVADEFMAMDRDEFFKELEECKKDPLYKLLMGINDEKL